MKLFEIFGEIKIDDKNANKILDATDKSASSLGDKLGGMAKTAGKWSLAIGGAAIAAGGALFGMATKGAEATDTIDKMSQRLGLSREGYQEWNYVLSQAGVEISSMQIGMKTLSQRMQEAVEGTGTGAEMFDKLGMSLVDSEGKVKSQEQAFNEAITALQGMDDGIEKAALAQDLFGRSGQELLPLLNGTSEGIDELKQAANDMGLVLTDEAIDAGVNFTDMKDSVVKSLGAIVTNVGVEVMPMFMGLFDWIIEHMPQIQETIRVVFAAIGTFVNVATGIFRDYFLPVLEAIFTWSKDNWPAIQSIVEGVFNAISFAWNNVLSPVLGLLLDAVTGIYNFAKDTFSGVSKIFEDVFDAVGTAVETVTDFFDDLIGAIKSAWEWLTQWNSTPAENKTVTTTYVELSSVDGSHADGLSYVPYDGYIAELHKGERVLTANESESLASGGGSSTVGQEITVTIPESQLNVNVILPDGKVLASVIAPFQQEIQRTRARGIGVTAYAGA